MRVLTRLATLLVTMTVVSGALCAPAPAADPPVKDDLVLPDGVGPVKLGMSITDARAAMPTLPINENVAAEANPPLSFKYAVAQLENQPFGDLEGCELTLHFYRERFIYYNVACPDKAATEAYLLKTYQRPGSKQPEVWQWTTKSRSMTFVPTSGAIAVVDNAGTQAYQLELFNLPRPAQQPQAQPGAATAAQPAAPAKP